MHKGKLTNINPPRITTEPFKKGVIWRYIEELAFHYKIKKGRLAEHYVTKVPLRPTFE